MASRRNTLLLSLQSLDWELPGMLSRKESLLLRATLHTPRPNVAERESVLLVQGNGRERITFTKLPFHQRVLFKQTVEGPFGLTLEISEPTPTEGLEATLLELRDIVVDTAGNLLATQLPAGLRSPFRAGFRFFGDQYLEGNPGLLASGSIDLDSQPRQTVTTLPLRSHDSIRSRETRARGPRKRRSSKPEILLKKGASLASLQLSLSIGD